jgi:hypothetical protein
MEPALAGGRDVIGAIGVLRLRIAKEATLRSG